MSFLAQTESTAEVFVPDVQYSTLLPIIIMVCSALVILAVVSLVRRKPPAEAWAVFTVLVAGAAIGTVVPLWNSVAKDSAQYAMQGTIVVDGLALFGIVTIAVAVLISAVVVAGYVKREGLRSIEIYVLMLLAAAGAALMVMGNELIVIFLGLEILSIALYVLAGYHRRRESSQEAAIKYFSLGAVASAIFLFGIAMVYGGSATTSLSEIRALLNTNAEPNHMLLFGMILLMVGLCFKVAAVPFHTWAPDVYQGSPTPVTGFMAAAVKTAAFIVFLRIMAYTFSPLADDWRPALGVIAALTLFFGAFLGAVQTDVKRMLAYSSIAHAGFIMLGVFANSQMGAEASLTYLFAYSIIVLGTFAIIGVIAATGDGNTSISAYRGLSKRQPGMTLALTIMLLAQAGIPPTSGFIAKFAVLGATVDNDDWWLALIAVLTGIVSAYIYLRIIRAMFSEPEPGTSQEKVDVPWPTRLAFGGAAFVTVLLGIVPGLLYDYAHAASIIG